MSASQKTPVIILNGFLGSGKTTLFRSLLTQSVKKGIRVCAIVNDMSELDVDGELLSNTGIVEENNGILQSIHSVVLSSKKGMQKLNQAVTTLLSSQNPELIIIETSGSCHPMPLIEYFKKNAKLRLTGVFTLVDCVMLAHDFDYAHSLFSSMQQNVSEGIRDTINLLVEQIMFASHILFTKVDRIGENDFGKVVSGVQTINPYVPAYSVKFGNFAIETIFELQEYDYFKVAQLTKELQAVLEAESHNDRPYDLATRVLKDDRPFNPMRLWDVCHRFLDKRIHRSKGFFWLASRRKDSLLWNQTAGEITLGINGSWRAGIVEDENPGISTFEIEELKKRLANEPGRFGDRRCDLTVIGDSEHVDRFTESLRSCFLTDEEIELWEKGHVFEDPWPKNLVKVQN